MSEPLALSLSVNGRQRKASAAPSATLLTLLRDELGLTGAKRGCNQGVCGACTVLLDDRPVRGCLTLAAACEGRAVTTVEGLSRGAALGRVQRAFVEAGAVQCGFCTAGMIVVAHALLQDNRHPEVDDVRAAISGNICRCSGYRKIVDAVCRAAAGAEP